MSSCNVVLPGPPPRDIQARNRRRVTTAGACSASPAGGATRIPAAPTAAAATLFSSRSRRVMPFFLLLFMIAPSHSVHPCGTLRTANAFVEPCAMLPNSGHGWEETLSAVAFRPGPAEHQLHDLRHVT